MSPKTVTSTPTFFNTVTYHLEMVDVTMCFLGLTKLAKRFWSFRRSLVFSIYYSRRLTTHIYWSGYLKSTTSSRWHFGRDCLDNSVTKIVTLPIFLVDGRHDASSMYWACFQISLLSVINHQSDKLPYLFCSTWGALVPDTVAVSEDIL